MAGSFFGATGEAFTQVTKQDLMGANACNLVPILGIFLFVLWLAFIKVTIVVPGGYFLPVVGRMSLVLFVLLRVVENALVALHNASAHGISNA